MENPVHRSPRLGLSVHLASLQLDLVGKSVLEVGAGVGDHTFYFLDRDCTVVSVEARRENCQLFGESMQALEASGYSKASRWKLVQGDVESLNGAVTGTFDVVYCYGLLYHLEDPAAALSAMAARCQDAIFARRRSRCEHPGQDRGRLADKCSPAKSDSDR